MSAGAYISINEITSKCRVSLRTLAYYEEIELVIPVRAGVERFYSERDVVRIQLILKGQKLGFSLEEIRQLMDTVAPPSEDVPSKVSRDEINRHLKILEDRNHSSGEALAKLRANLFTKRQ